MISYIAAIIIGLFVIGLDQYTKYLIDSSVICGTSKDFIKGVIDITYIKNSGGAWGMLSGHTWILVSVTLVVMLVCIALIMRYGMKNKWIFWALILVLSGGLGNMIDRIARKGEVIDFLHLSFFPDFPVFNIADCAVCIGAFMIVGYFVKSLIDDAKEKRAAAKKAPEENGKD